MYGRGLYSLYHINFKNMSKIQYNKVVGFEAPKDEDYFFLIMEDQYFKKGDIILNENRTKSTVLKVYRRNWFTLLLDRFATYIKNKTRITSSGITIKIKKDK